MIATLCESLDPSARNDLASSGNRSDAASTCARTCCSVPATATICFGARTTHESKSTFSLFADDATARTATAQYENRRAS